MNTEIYLLFFCNRNYRLINVEVWIVSCKFGCDEEGVQFIDKEDTELLRKIEVALAIDRDFGFEGKVVCCASMHIKAPTSIIYSLVILNVKGLEGLAVK